MTGSIFLFRSAKVQTYLTQKAANYLSTELNAKISIEAIDVEFFNKLVLDGLLVMDQQNDTLTYVKKLKLGVTNISKGFENIELNTIELMSPYINIYSIDSSMFNYSFIKNYFKVESDTSKIDLMLLLSELKISEGKFYFHNFNIVDHDFEVNYSHVDVTGLNLHAQNISFNDSALSSIVQSLSFKEENGFELNNLTTKFVLKEGEMDFKDLKIQTERSEVSAQYNMRYDSISDFKEFIDKVKLKSKFINSLVDFNDLAFFVPLFKGITNTVFITGDVKGNISNLKGRNLSFQVDKDTYFNGKFDMRGLPNIEETYMYFKLDQFKTNYFGLRKLPFPPFDNGKNLKIPENVNSLGNIFFSGEFTGFYNDFVSYGEFSTALGNLKTDISLRENESGVFEYLGEINSNKLSIGRFVEFEKLSEIGFNLKIDGKGFALEEIEANAVGEIDHLVLNNYRYEDLKLNGDFENQKFIGELDINDENLALHFNGLIDASKDKMISQFDLVLKSSNLAKLNLFREYDSLTYLSFSANLDIIGTDIDEIEGFAKIKNIHFKDSKLDHSVDYLNLDAIGNQLNRKIELKSDLLDAEITGAFAVYKIPKTIYRFIKEYMPLDSATDDFVDNQNFRFSFLLKNTDPFTEVFLPELKIDSATELYGQIDTESRFSNVFLRSTHVIFNGLESQEVDVELNSKPDTISSKINSNKFIFNNLKLEGITTSTTLSHGDLNSTISWKKVNGESHSGDLDILGKLYSYNKIDLSFINSSFNLNDSLWEFSNNNVLEIDSSSIQITNFDISNGLQRLSFNGGVSNSEDTLDIKLSQLNLAYISKLLPEGILELKGVASGTARLQNFYTNLSLSSDLKLNSLTINETHIGAANLFSIWNPKEKSFVIDANLGDSTENVLALKGMVFPLKKENSLDLVLSLKEAPISLLKPYLTDILSDLKGSISGSIDITGEASKPILLGGFDLNNTAFKIDYLNTSYSINDHVIVRPDFIGFNLIKLRDERGKDAIATGTIFHDNYSNFNLDIGLELDKFLALNTNSKQNDLYYGKAIVSGNANISGYADQMILELTAATEKGTDFKIPISDGVDVSETDFIIFTNSHENNSTTQEKLDLTGIQLNFDLDINEDSKLQIIFDEHIGDIMKAKGIGNLKLEINTLGNFNIYGQYIVQEGDYLFTLQNVINKKFKIAQGSQISWDGDPYNAAIDIKAIYNLRASLYDIIPEDTSSNNRRRVPVELELQLSEKLLTPNIDFDIRLPNSDERKKQRLESVIYVNSSNKNSQELNQQVFGLLVLNRFLPPASGVASESGFDRGAPGVNNGYEFLSNQMSNILSKMSDQFDFGVNYRPGDEVSNDEFDFSVSTEVFNDRLVLDGNLGYSGTNEDIESQSSSAVIGEFSAEYKLSKDGRFRVRGFNRSTNNNLLKNASPYTQGVGLFYREEFNSLDELWKQYFYKKDKKRK
jgi:hypothetical protein